MTIDYTNVAPRLGITAQQLRAWSNGNVDYDLSAITDAIVAHTGVEPSADHELLDNLEDAGIITAAERAELED